MTPREIRILATAAILSGIFAVMLVRGMDVLVDWQLKKLSVEGSSLDQD